MKIKYIFLLSSMFLLGCTKDSDVAADNEFRAFTTCIDQDNSSSGLFNMSYIVVGTVPSGKQWSIVSYSFFNNSAIQIDNSIIEVEEAQFPIYVNEGQKLTIHGNYVKVNTVDNGDCISINEYNID